MMKQNTSQTVSHAPRSSKPVRPLAAKSGTKSLAKKPSGPIIYVIEKGADVWPFKA
jgi:hypothetical protein